MKILAIADRGPQHSILETIQENKIDMVVTLGDLEFSELTELSSITKIPKLGIYGNHCSGNYFDPLGIQNMHLKTFEFNGLTFGGFEGCVRYKESKYSIMYTQEEAFRMFINFPKIDVLLTHCPPYGIQDKPEEVAHQGFHILRWYIEIHHPKYLLHGHTYPDISNKVVEYKGTKVVHIYEDEIINLK
jgi:uncharacterized protein